MSSRRSVSLAFVVLLCCGGCGDADPDASDSPNASRCGALCEEDSCAAGESRATCVDECVAQSDGLEASCVQCLIEDSSLTTRRLLEDGGFCVWDVNVGWTRCEANGVDCFRGSDEVEVCADESLPAACELNFGSIEDCSDFCA